MEKTTALEVPVLFQFPVNASPGECAGALEAYRRNNQNTTLFEGHGYLVKDLEGIHTWRNARDGRVMITAGIQKTFWGNSWTLKPKTTTVHNEWTGIGAIHNGYFYVFHWVLCDELSCEKLQEWEARRRFVEAKALAAARAQPSTEPLQLGF